MKILRTFLMVIVLFLTSVGISSATSVNFTFQGVVVTDVMFEGATYTGGL